MMLSKSLSKGARKHDLAVLADFAEQVAKPVAANLLESIEQNDGAAHADIAASLGLDEGAPARVVLRALELAAREYGNGGKAERPEARREVERAARLAAGRIVAGWRDAAARLQARRGRRRAAHVPA